MDTTFKQQLKAKAHHLKPVVIIGAKGFTDSVIEETNQALMAHELIKIKIQGMEKAERRNKAQEICETLEAELIQMIGNTLILYRPNPE